MDEQQKGKHITLKHLLIDGKRMIVLQFYSDKVVQALQAVARSALERREHMVFVPNTKEGLDRIFSNFKGVCWVNCKYFLPTGL